MRREEGRGPSRRDCLKLLTPEDLLAPFELKAAGLILRPCREDCRLESAAPWLERLVRQANGILATVGLGERIRLAESAEAASETQPD